MKKTTKLLAMMVVTTLIFSACSKVEEDTYFPKVKLTSVVSQNNTSYVFNYDKKFISSIVMDNSETINVTYNKDNQISELSEPADNGKILLTYQDGKIAKSSYYDSGTLVYEVVFIHSGDHISKVQIYGNSDDWDKTCQKPLFNLCYNANLVKQIVKDNPKSTLPLQMETAWTYTGDNLTQTATSYSYLGITMTLKETMTYDDKANPFYGLPYPIALYGGYSANNRTSYIQSTVLGSSSTIVEQQNYTYTYNNNDYPTYCAVTDANGAAVDIVSYSYNK